MYFRIFFFTLIIVLTACTKATAPELTEIDSVDLLDSSSSVTIEVNTSSTQAETITSAESSPSTVIDTSTEFTLAQVSQHGTSDSCYTVINEFVYDLTSFVSSHPGGERNITKICGRDGTSIFSGNHGSDASALEQLATMKIGVLVE